MRIIVASDTHGNDKYLRSVLEERGGITHLVHLGDGNRELRQIEQDYPDITVFGVRGNNDLSPIYPDEFYFELCGRKFFMTHGHLYGVRTSLTKLYEKAKAIGADTVLFGHTHLKCDKEFDGIRFLNPSAYGVILISDNKIEFI